MQRKRFQRVILFAVMISSLLFNMTPVIAQA